MVFLTNAPTKVLQWKSANLTGVSSGNGSNTQDLTHNQGKLVSYVKLIKNEGTASEHYINVFDEEANLSSTVTNHTWGYRWLNLNNNTCRLILHRQDLETAGQTVRAILYFFD